MAHRFLLILAIAAFAVWAEKPAPQTSPPKIVKKTQPEYTAEAREAKISGTVTLRARLDAEGRLQDIRVVRGLGHGLDAKAVESLRQWVWEPAMRDDEAVAVEVGVDVTFRLDGMGSTAVSFPRGIRRTSPD